MSDHYRTLGLLPPSSKSEIKRVFHALCHKYHPDKNDGKDEAFKRISFAYHALISSTWMEIVSETQKEDMQRASNEKKLQEVFCNDKADFFWTEDVGGIVKQWWGKWPTTEQEHDDPIVNLKSGVQ